MRFYSVLCQIFDIILTFFYLLTHPHTPTPALLPTGGIPNKYIILCNINLILFPCSLIQFNYPNPPPTPICLGSSPKDQPRAYLILIRIGQASSPLVSPTSSLSATTPRLLQLSLATIIASPCLNSPKITPRN